MTAERVEKYLEDISCRLSINSVCKKRIQPSIVLDLSEGISRSLVMMLSQKKWLAFKMVSQSHGQKCSRISYHLWKDFPRVYHRGHPEMVPYLQHKNAEIKSCQLPKVKEWKANRDTYGSILGSLSDAENTIMVKGESQVCKRWLSHLCPSTLK